MADDDFIEMLEAADARITAALPAILAKAAEHVKTVATPLVPHLTGNLAGSGGVTADATEARLLYPGPYARYQHYGLDFRHPQGGQALYLEQPMITEAPKVFKIIADGIGDVL